MNNFATESLRSERSVNLPNVDSLLKISLGLVLLTMISFALVYAETIPVDVEGNSFDVNYDVTGITVDAIASDVEASSLYLTVTANSSGALNITFDRLSFDSVFEGLDEEFFVLIDGDFAIYSEIETTTQSRTLSIEVPSGSEEVEIIGTVFGDPESSVISDKAAADKAAADKAAADKAAAASNTTQPIQCGPGTILQNGACVLDERCGPGTILKAGTCVLDSTVQPSDSSAKGMGKEMLMGIIVAFVVAGTIGIILGLMSKAGKSKR